MLSLRLLQAALVLVYTLMVQTILLNRNGAMSSLVRTSAGSPRVTGRLRLAGGTLMSARAASRHSRPLLGLRRKPGRLALAVFRMPLHAYRRNVGWLFGRTFLEFVHVGRTSGRQYETVAMVLYYQRATREAVIARPGVQHRLGAQPASGCRDPSPARPRFLHPAAPVPHRGRKLHRRRGFRRAHPWRLRLLRAILGWGDLRGDAAVRDFILNHPFVAFRPAADPSAPSADTG